MRAYSTTKRALNIFVQEGAVSSKALGETYKLFASDQGMGIFSRCQITLELDSTVNFKFKTALKKKIVDNDGIVSFIVTKKVYISNKYNILLCNQCPVCF